jgi:tetratricopeptide (TPR) repeat protein
MKFMMLCLLSLILLMGSSAVSTMRSPDSPDSDIQARFAAIDSVFRYLDYKKTERLIKDGLKNYPGNAGFLWRYSNLMVNAGDAVPEEKRMSYFERAVKYADRAVKADPKNANAHAFVAASHGSIGLYAGKKEKIKLAYVVRDALNLALKLDPKNYFAHTVYGGWHRELADLSWIERSVANLFLGELPDASYKKSVYHYKQANRARSCMLRNRYGLGLTYDAMDKESMAVKEFKRALKCPNTAKADNRRRKIMKEYIEDNL